MLGVMVPPALLVARLRDVGGGGMCRHLDGGGAAAGGDRPEVARLLCYYYRDRPFVFLNLLYVAVVDVGFWAIYLLQGSTWLIDPHWQWIPMQVALFWFTHPAANQDHPRAIAALVLVMVWGARLLHNYFRRERWHFGRHEDWRYADMRREHGRWWWITQFGAVSLAQHGMLVGLTMPLQAAMTSTLPFMPAADVPAPAPFNWLDGLACAGCLAGIVIGACSDNQLWRYMQLPPEEKPIVLDTGLWRYSRHPNHFGEQTWWIFLLLLGCASGASVWPICFGVCFNHPLDTFVTLGLIEKRMLRREARRVPFAEYQRCTSLIVPWPPKPKRVEFLLAQAAR